MEKSLLKKQIIEKIEELNISISARISDPNFSVDELTKALSINSELTRLLSVYQYLLSKREISEDLDLHMKIIASTEEEKINETAISQPEEEITTQPPEAISLQQEIQPEPSMAEPIEKSPQPIVTTKKMELSINDRYRILNELFHQNQTEFNMVISELNATENLPQTELYLSKLCELYEWNPDNSLVKTFFSIAKKRFK